MPKGCSDNDEMGFLKKEKLHKEDCKYIIKDTHTSSKDDQLRKSKRRVILNCWIRGNGR
jgi:hypothetical protein